MNYYLETNALRQLSGKLPSLPNNCFTSGLSILELISGMSDESFVIRKRVLENLLQSKIPINWDLPETIQARAFPYIEYVDYRIADLQKICFAVIENDSFENAKIETSTLVYDFQYFKELDDYYSKRFIDATALGNKKIREVIDNTKNQPMGELLHPIVEEFHNNLRDNSELNELITRYVISEGLYDAAEAFEPNAGIDRAKVFSSYNGSIDIFIKAFSFFVASKSTEQNLPAKNDFVDLHHLTYLKGASNFIITDDKMIQEYCFNSLSIEVYLEKYT